MQTQKVIVRPWLLIILLILLFGEISFFTWRYWSIKNQPVVEYPLNTVLTSDSKTYTNTQYDFSFKHSEDWVLDTERTSANRLVFKNTKVQNPDSIESIVITKNDSAVTLDTFVTDLLKSNTNYKQANNLKIGGEDAIKIETGEFATDNYIFFHKGDIYSITTQAGLFTAQTLSTFQFTDSQISTADWKTYENKEIGFSFKYPADWTIINNGGGINFTKAIISINSPETNKERENTQFLLGSDLSVYYFDSVKNEPENTGNNLNASTLAEFLQKNDLLKKIGTTKVGDYSGTKVVIAGDSPQSAIYLEVNKHLYEIFYRAGADPNSSVGKAILASFQFTK